MLGSLGGIMDESVNHLIVDLDLIRRLDKNGPRYTSYPTADRFVETFNAATYSKWVAKRESDGFARPLSLYIHIPFCNTLCFYCACNKVITKNRSKSAEYVRYLIKEMAMQAMLLGPDQVVEQLHFGGGTPTFLSDDEIRLVMTAIRQHFKLVKDGEYSIEIDPRKGQTVDQIDADRFESVCTRSMYHAQRFFFALDAVHRALHVGIEILHA
jgi:oxygen-independent coproporphyrinogen III oxidase